MAVDTSSANSGALPRLLNARRQTVGLIGVAAVFVALGTVVSVKTPAWEAQDEASHVQNVEVIAAGHWYRIPPSLLHRRDLRPRPSAAFLSNELHQPPLYYVLLAGWQRMMGQPAHNVDPGPASLITLALGHGLYLRHSSSDHRFLLWLRIPNLLLGLLTIYLTFLAVRVLTTEQWIPVIAAAIVAFLPRFLFLSSFVTNDNLVNVLGAGLAYAGVRAVASAALRWSVIVGALLGLLVLTKLSALTAIVVLIPIALARRGWAPRAQVIAAALVTMLVIGGWYLVQNDVRYGDPLAIAASEHYLAPLGGLGTLGPYVLHDPLRLIFLSVPSRVLHQFWYASTMPPFTWPLAVDAVFWLAVVLALSRLATVRNSSNGVERLSRHQLGVLVTLVIAAFTSVWVVAFNTAAYDARLAFLGLPSLACLCALGLDRWKPPIRLVLPILELSATIVAIQQNVLSVHWTP